MRSSTFGPVLVWSLFVLAASSCTPDTVPYRIGLVAGLSSGNADLGEAGRNGAMVAIEEANRQGGIGGHPIELVIRDDGNLPDQAKAAAKDLINQKVELIVGPFTSAMAQAVLQAAEPKGVLVFSPTASSSIFSEKDDQFVRLCSNTTDNARAYADFAVAHRGYRQITMVRDQQNVTYTRAWGDAFDTAAQGLGGKIILDLWIDSQMVDSYQTLARRLLTPRPDAVLLVTSTVDVARISQQIRKLDSKVPIIVSEWAGTEQLIELAGAAADGIETLQLYDQTGTQDKFQAFMVEYRERFNAEPSFSSVMAYETIGVVLQAQKLRTNSETLKQAILNHGPYQGLQQEFRIDRFGDVRRQSFFVRVVENHFERAP